MADIIVTWWNYVRLLGKAVLQVVAHFSIYDLGAIGNEIYFDLSSIKYSLNLTL
jgi:hypothetical protein